VFPHTQHFPSEALERAVDVPVALLVSDNLGDPQMRVRFWHAAVLTATMPEASIYEDREAESSEYYVGCSGKTASTVQSISITLSV
jgi:hypothetical protein